MSISSRCWSWKSSTVAEHVLEVHQSRNSRLHKYFLLLTFWADLLSTKTQVGKCAYHPLRPLQVKNKHKLGKKNFSCSIVWVWWSFSIFAEQKCKFISRIWCSLLGKIPRKPGHTCPQYTTWTNHFTDVTHFSALMRSRVR